MPRVDPGVYYVDKLEYLRLLGENKQFEQTMTTRVRLILCFCLISLVLGITLEQVIKKNNLAQQFLNDGKGGYTPVTPLINHPVSDTQAIQYAGRVVSRLLSFHFLYLEEQLTSRRTLFYGDGFEHYHQSLINNLVINAINEKSLIITVVPSGDVKLSQKPFFEGQRDWLIEVPIITTAAGGDPQPQTSKSTIIIILHEVDRIINVDGLQVRQFYLGV